MDHALSSKAPVLVKVIPTALSPAIRLSLNLSWEEHGVQTQMPGVILPCILCTVGALAAAVWLVFDSCHRIN